MNTNYKALIIEELNPPLNTVLVTDGAGLEKLQDYIANHFIFAFDVESNMTDNFTERKLRTIQFGDRNQQFVIDLLPFAQAAGITLEEAMSEPYKPHACLRPIYHLVERFLNSRNYLKIGHNIQFDYETVKYCLGVRGTNLYCTFLNEKLLYAGAVPFQISGFWALDDLVCRYMGLQISKEHQTTFDLVTPLTPEQIAYCGLDCRLPMGIYAAQKQKLEAAGLLRVSTIENAAIPAFGDMFLNGMLVDKKKWLKTVHKYKKLHKKHIAKLDEFFIPVVGTKDYDDSHLAALEQKWRETEERELRAEHRKTFMAERKRVNELRKNHEKFPGQAAINYASPVAMFNVMKELPRFVEANKLAAEASGKRERGVPWFRGTDDRTLGNFAEHSGWDVAKAHKLNPDLSEVGMIDALRLYRETEKLLNSYGTDWLRKNVNKRTGRVHGRVTQLGADTGRTSCKNPNMQQLPRGEEWRSCFIAAPGRKLITVDYSGAELVILAELSQDPIFVHAYRNGWDVHSVVAELIFGDEWKDATEPGCKYYEQDHKKCSCTLHKEMRNKAKPVGLGTAYGMMDGKLADSIGVSIDEAGEILKAFYAKFEVLIAYLTKSGNSAKDTCESRSLSGRRRLFSKPEYRDAAVKAKRKLEEKGVKDKAPSRQQISWALHAMYSAIEREGKNNPLQSSNADITKLAMSSLTLEQECGNIDMLWNFLEPKYDALIVMMVHDELVIEVDEAFAGTDEEPGECTKEVAKAMIASAADLVKSVPMGIEFHVENYWKK